MIYVFPAADAAEELFHALHQYAQQFPQNPIINAVVENRRQGILGLQHSDRYRYVLGEVRRFKAEINRRTGLARQAPDIASKVQYLEAIGTIWDQLDRFEKNLLGAHSPTSSIYDDIHTYLQHIAKAMNFRVRGVMPQLDPNLAFTRNECRRIIKAVIEDEVRLQMRWVEQLADEKGDLELTLLELFPNWDALDPSTLPQGLSRENAAAYREHVERCCGHFFRAVIEPMLRKISHWVHNYIPYQTWNVWTVRSLGADLALEQGEDFRILDWERRTRSGKWSHTPVTAALTTDFETSESKDEVSFEEQNEQDITSTLKRYQSEQRIGFSPKLFRARLTERDAPSLGELNFAERHKDHAALRMSQADTSPLAPTNRKSRRRGLMALATADAPIHPSMPEVRHDPATSAPSGQ